MWRPSLTAIISGLFLAFVGNSLFSVARLFIPPDCGGSDESSTTCFSSVLHDHDSPDSGSSSSRSRGIRLLLLTTEKSRPALSDKDMEYWTHLDLPDFDEARTESLDLVVPHRVIRNNGTLYLAVLSLPFLVNDDPGSMPSKKTWLKMAGGNPETTFTMVKLTHHHVPEAEAFNLVSSSGSGGGSGEEMMVQKTASAATAVPKLHLMSKLRINIMTEPVRFSKSGEGVPAEMAHMIRIIRGRNYLPMVHVNELSQRLSDLVLLNDTNEVTNNKVKVEVQYAPVTWGRLRMLLQFSGALVSMRLNLGFSAKDTDEVKGIFADTSLPLLMTTLVVSALHLLFDFLAFKNDVTFWKGRTSLAGLSRRTLIWRAFSQSVVFFYLVDEGTSLLVLGPSCIAALIEIWKLFKATNLRKNSFQGQKSQEGQKSQNDRKSQKDLQEETTEEFDREAMRYLSYLLYPLLVLGAGYSLLYTKHRSWWSWTLQSLVNGVYAFGFLFMLPQLFVNYRLKSVAHLPWRAFMYKAFNTFIDDLFAFIITMPTAHRVACFRDDAVFLVYLYQRYLYPVDKSRVDTSASIDQDPPGHNRPIDDSGSNSHNAKDTSPIHKALHQRKAKAQKNSNSQ